MKVLLVLPFYVSHLHALIPMFFHHDLKFFVSLFIECFFLMWLQGVVAGVEAAWLNACDSTQVALGAQGFERRLGVPLERTETK